MRTISLLYLCCIMMMSLLSCTESSNDEEAVESVSNDKEAGHLVEDTLAAFLDGDTATVIDCGTLWMDADSSAHLPAFLLSIAYFLEGDLEQSGRLRLAAMDDEASIPEIETQLSRFTEDTPNSPWTTFAFGLLAEGKGEHLEAQTLYEVASSLFDAAPDSVRHTAAVAADQSASVGVLTEFAAAVSGVLRPIDGPWGRLLPLPGETEIVGEAKCIFGELEFTGTISGWAYLYPPLSDDPIGWGVSVTDGRLLMARADYDAIVHNTLPVVADQAFHVLPFDYFGRFVILTISETLNELYVIPIQVHWPLVSTEAERNTIELPKDFSIQGSIYTVSDYDGPAGGVTIGANGERIMFGTDGQRVALKEGSKTSGTLGTVSAR